MTKPGIVKESSKKRIEESNKYGIGNLCGIEQKITQTGKYKYIYIFVMPLFVKQIFIFFNHYDNNII
jgi:hypothetical protein